MSGKRLSFTTAGIRCTGGVSGGSAARIASPVASCTSRWRPAWSRSSRRGCSTRSPAPGWSSAVLVATPAFAFHCPQEMAKIDKALAANPKLSQADLTKVRELRAKGEAEHKAGNHQASLDTLAQAEKMLGIQ